MPFDPTPSVSPPPIPLARIRRLAFRVLHTEGKRCDVDDLIQEGVLGVLLARRSGVSITTNAVSYEMRAAYLRMIACARRWIGRSPKRARNIAAMHAARDGLASTLGREPYAAEIAARLGWTLQRVWGAMLDDAQSVSPDVEHIAASDIEERAIAFQSEDALSRALRLLSSRQGWIMRERSEGRTHASLASELDCNRKTIIREEQRAVASLRQAMGVA